MLLVAVNAVAIDIHAPRQTVPPAPAAKRVEGRRRGLGLVEPGVGAVGRIGDQHHQHAPGCPTLEPVVMRAVHLDHAAPTGPALPPLAMPVAPPTTLPQMPLLEQSRERVRAEHQTFGREFLTGKGRAEVRISLLMTLDDPRPQFLGQPTVAGAAPQPMHQTARPVDPVTLPQPPRLTQRYAHERRRRNHRQFASFHPMQRIQTNPFLDRHTKCFHSDRYTPARAVTLLFRLRGDNSTPVQRVYLYFWGWHKMVQSGGKSRLFKEQAMERLKQMDREEFVRAMQAEVRAALERVADAVNGAAEGRVINGSEKAVRAAMVELQRRSFEKALQMRVDSTELAFSPSAGRGGG